jgi:hypothetical protein
MSIITHLVYIAQTPVSTSGLPTSSATAGTVKAVLDVVLTITGSIALLMITIGGFRYIISRGDPSATAQAKDTILYALVGLVVSILAYAIVGFVVNST